MFGIALDGGAMRLPFFGGFFKKFQEEEIEVDQIVGVSSGALLAMGYIAGVSMQEAYEAQLNWAFEHRLDYKIYVKYLDYFDSMIDESKLPLFNRKLKILASRITLTGLRTEVFDSFKDSADLKAKMVASGSIPYFNEFPARVNGNFYLDGYITCSNPARFLTTDRKLSVITVPEFADFPGAKKLGDLVVMDSLLGHSFINTFLVNKEAVKTWFDYGYRKAEEYLASRLSI